jgi:hypothetical protein
VAGGAFSTTASSAPASAIAAYPAVGMSSLTARPRSQTVALTPRECRPDHDSAAAYPPTKKNTGITWNPRVTH